MIFVFYNIYHIRYILLIYGEYHIKYDFMHIVCLSYLLRGFRHTDPETPGVGSSFNTTTRNNPMTQDVASQSTNLATRYCVMYLSCDPARRGRKDRFAYSMTVVHFRKVLNMQKIGSPGKADTVISLRFYKSDCNCILLKLHH